MKIHERNREFLVTYYRKEADIEDIRCFKTLKELSDWFDANDEEIVITNIRETSGRSIELLLLH